MELSAFFEQHDRIALAFSGGVDSSYLLYAAMQCGANIRAYYVKSAFQPQFELEDAKKLAAQLHADLQVISVDILSVPAITANPSDRCYDCKKVIFSCIAAQALADGYPTLIDGTNASDDTGDRPGMRALKELSVLSPLREYGLTKHQVRQLSKEAGLFTWNKPAYACLATRIPTGTVITEENLKKTELAEDYLASLGFCDFRVRLLDDTAKIQISEAQIPLLMEHRTSIITELKKYYHHILLDLEVRNGSIS